jgi:hypothetical protein
VNRQSNIIDLSTFSKDRFCQVAIYQKQAASTDKATSFEREWSNLVLASFDAATKVLPQQKKTRHGYNVLYFGSQGKSRNDDKPYYVELYMFDCGNSVQSAMLVSASKEHLQFFDSSWQSLITRVKNSGADTVVALPGGTFTGQWGKTSMHAYGTNSATAEANSGYYKYYYDFKPNGTYTLHGESSASSNDYMLIDESGGYTILDKQLVIMPAQSKLQQVDKNGKAKKTENPDRSRRIYTWQHNDINLILTPVKDYPQDGGFSSYAQYPNAYVLSMDYRPEWKFPVK